MQQAKGQGMKDWRYCKGLPPRRQPLIAFLPDTYKVVTLA